MQSWVDRAVEQGKFEVITCEHSVNEIYVRPQWRSRLTTVVNIHSSVYRTCQSQLQTQTSENPWRDRLYLPLLYRYEQKFLRKFSRLVVTTSEDREQLQQLSPAQEIRVIPNGVDLDIFPYRPADPGGHRLIFFGGLDYLANIDAACFLAREILPPIQRRFSDATLILVGSQPAPEVLALAERPGVRVTGRVPAIAPYLHQATVCVIPLRTGFGIKNKTLEAMAAGIPVVGSDRGLEGLAVDDAGLPRRALRANRVPEYVEAIQLLLTNTELRVELSRNGRNLVVHDYSWQKAAKNYEQAISPEPQW